MTPLARACAALCLPKGLYLDRGDIPRRDAEIRLALRQQHVSAERLTLALADTLAALVGSEDAADVWRISAVCAERRRLPASAVGMLAALAMIPDEGSVEPDEWGFMVEAAP